MIIVSFGLSHYSLSTTVNGLINHQVGDSIIAVNWENLYILCTIRLAISYVSHLYVLIFQQYRTILIAMTRTRS